MINENDLKLLSFKVPVLTSIGTKVKAILSSLENVQLVEKERVSTSTRAILDLQETPTYEENARPIPDGFYKLKLLENGLDLLEGIYYFSNRLYSDSSWGVIDFYIDAQDPNYNLLDTTGNLKTKKNTASDSTVTIDTHPIYELRLEGDFT